MDHLEMVEKLREKANVTYEEARDALEAADWDLLDALLMLESAGKLNEMEQAAYTTREEAKQTDGKPAGKAKASGVFARLMHALAGLIKKGNAVTVQAKKNGEVRLELSLTVIVLLLVFSFWAVPIAAILAMLFGYRFSIRGLKIDDSVNSAMDKAGSFVDSVVKPENVHVVRDGENEQE
ncbi:MAG: DUF4342 domain-containing protein [Clostridia bacterium]|nr:DUF4342 domain-containing protein [Clostridia bacterium]